MAGQGSRYFQLIVGALVLLTAAPGCRVPEVPVDVGPMLYFAASADNDLYRVLTDAGWAPDRYDTPEEAVDAAPDGSGVLIPADGYPAVTTDVAPEVLDRAASKQLRLYIEYPTELPNQVLEAPQEATVERAVVASDFFGSGLPAGRILAVHGLHYVPAQIDSAHVVAARVAGFDSAVFGLPTETAPILFEQGNLLVATTKLSQFVTGRYAPTDAWQALWQRVLAWLAPDETIPELAWTPTVRTSYGPDDPLPEDAEAQALRRGTEWFERSKLLLPESRLPEIDAAFETGDGRAPTPPPDAPVGDGSLGILEAPLSVILPDGNQMQSVVRRSDCIAESAMGLAFGSAVLDQASQSDVARNLLNYLYFDSPARKQERGDPSHGAYGLIAWGISTPAWYTANYGDDNARAMLATLAASALMGEDRWDEGVMMALLGNLRTTGSLGFRGDRIDLPALSEQGWRPFFEREHISYLPHMEAYLWATYLWAYQQTGIDLFYQRAENAIRMTMAVYPDSLKWMNGLAQEKARMLLPLSWLVRVRDTPEHRQWLDRAVTEVLALQDASGGIREELGDPALGRYPPPASNEAYGGNEASLIQQNGDPVSDLLYTTNFAFLGLHEAAAATGDVRIREAENRLAEFLVRIQVHSDAHPALDGGWFRAFDFERWEAWGSNADAGWGAWAIESGWTQGWITAVLAMRQLQTSLWDLTADSRIERHAESYWDAMLPGIGE